MEKGKRMEKKTIDPAPIIKILADRCLQAKGLECSVLGDVIDLLRAAPDAGERWIPVSEAMPELIPCDAGTAYSEAVEIWTTGKKVMIAVYDGVDFLCAASYWDAEGEEITHWKPVRIPNEVRI